MAVTLEDVKLYLGIPTSDTLQDDLLTRIINDATTLVTGYTGEDVLAPSLEWVVREMVITRYNRIGSEGMKATSEEGKSESYADDLFGFAAFVPFIDENMKVRGLVSGRGKAKFL